MSVNKVILVANVGKDGVDLKYTPIGTAVANFSVATNERYKDKDGNKQEKTTWHRIVAWRQLAEICGKYLTPGKQVYLEGKIENRSYEKDGSTRYITEIVADQMQMLGRAGDGAESGQRTERPAQRPDGGNAGSSSQYDEGYSDDIPF